MLSDRIVLDTNCLLVSISRYGEAYPVWRGFLDGRFTLCVSTEILEEYEDMSFPELVVIRLKEFLDTLQKDDKLTHYS